MHTPAEIGIEDFQANRSPDKRDRTTPLKGLFVVNHDNKHFSLRLTDEQSRDLSEYLKSL